MISEYYWLTKPGIIYGNAITTIGGFFLASKGQIDWLLLVAVLFGISFVIASACVFNNIMDRDIDAKMGRTQHRAMVSGAISKSNAGIFGIILGLIGFSILWFYTNPLAMLIGFVGFFVYVAIYSPLKKRSVHATLVGTIPGSAPLIAGYCAVTNNFDKGALILFIIMVTWQMAHFYAIAIRRNKEYAAASVPVMSVKKGTLATKKYIMFYIVAYIAAIFLLYWFGFTGIYYLIVMELLALVWFYRGAQGFKTIDDSLWAKRMFKFSLVLLLAFSVMISINPV